MGRALSQTIEKARSIGAEFRISGERRVMVRGLSLLPPEIRAVLRENKVQLLEYLESECPVPLVIRETGDVTQINALPAPREAEPVTTAPLTGGSTPETTSQELLSQIENWVTDDPKRWQRIHDALLRIYAPSWGRIDERDILVSWAAAHLALNRAKCELKRIESLWRPLTRRELDTRGGRQADVSFWGRLAYRLAAKIPEALDNAVEATTVLSKLIKGK